MTFRRFTLQELASEDFIARSRPSSVEKVRQILATLTPDTLVREGDDTKAEPLSLSALAKQHQESSIDEDEPMTAEEAWEWAVRDVVFFGFWPVEEGPPA